MTGPLAQCVAGQCGSIDPSTPASKLALSFLIVLVGVGVLAATFALLETPERCHRVFHRLFPKAFCGRCLQKRYADATDKAFNKSTSHSKLTQSVEAPR